MLLAAFLDIVVALGVNAVTPASPLSAATALDLRGDSGDISAWRSDRDCCEGEEDLILMRMLLSLFPVDLFATGDTKRSMSASAPVTLSERRARCGMFKLLLMASVQLVWETLVAQDLGAKDSSPRSFGFEHNGLCSAAPGDSVGLRYRPRCNCTSASCSVPFHAGSLAAVCVQRCVSQRSEG